MKKTIAVLFLAAAAASPAFASDGSETAAGYQAQSGYEATSFGMDTYAFAPRGNRQHARDANTREQSQMQWSLIDR